jgi:hypothetical protein
MWTGSKTIQRIGTLPWKHVPMLNAPASDPEFVFTHYAR